MLAAHTSPRQSPGNSVANRNDQPGHIRMDPFMVHPALGVPIVSQSDLGDGGRQLAQQ
jgi:hypothetical protein